MSISAQKQLPSMRMSTAYFAGTGSAVSSMHLVARHCVTCEDVTLQKLIRKRHVCSKCGTEQRKT